MKKFITLLILYSVRLFAQNETDCPFQAQKYVPYDGEFKSNTSYLPVYYSQLLQNNNNYERTVSHLTNPAIASCFYKTSIHNHDSILKPFVFVEGISFEKRGINNNSYTMASYFRQDWYPSPPPDEPECITSFNSAPLHLNDNVGYSTFNWATLVTGIDAEGYHSGDPLKVEKAPELLNQLCCAGYDICFVDFMSGEAYIESNGEALYSILVQLHQKLVDNNSTEKMVVCGASMGGLVARYAINKLEAEGHTDWVEKFISFDAPQMGANIPLGVQFTLKQFAPFLDDIKEKYEKLTCPSASQLVNYSCLETNISSSITYTTPTQSLERFGLLMNPYMGWPQHCAKVAISNGSRLGTTQSLAHLPSDKVLDIDGIIDLDIYALPQNDNNYKKLFDFDPPICFAAATANGAAFFASLALSKSIFVKETMALDLAPGSFRTDLLEIKNSLPNYLSTLPLNINNCGLNTFDGSTDTDKLCFIPLMSSIGSIDYTNIMKSHNALTQATLNAVFDGDSKFEDYNHQFSHFDVAYAPATNQSHVEITDENIGWVMHELTGMEEVIWHENKYLTSNTFKARDQIRAGNNIFGNPVCGLPAITPGGGGLTGNGSNVLEQNMHCGDVKSISNHAVFYKSGNFISLESGFYTEDDALFQAEIIPIPVCYSNQRTASPANQNESNSNSFNSPFGKNKSAGQITDSLNERLEIIAQNINIFPNPANNYVDISSNDNITSIALSTLMGASIYSQTINENIYRLTTSELANGIYLLTIKTAQKTLNKKVIVRHE